MTTQIVLGAGWWVSLFGWPAVFGAVVAWSMAVAGRSRRAAIVGCILASPTLLYLSLTPRFGWVALLALALLCVLAWRIERSGWVSASLLALPAAGIVARLVYALVAQ